MTKSVYLHIGVHKTGSTSLQRFLGSHRDQLAECGYEFFRGSVVPNNHVELYLGAMRKGRDSFAQQTHGLAPGPQLFDRVRNEVSQFLSQSRQDRLVFSCEGLSLLRFDDELSRLKQIIQAENSSVTVILVLRDKTDYLKAYRRQILKDPKRAPSSDPKSSFYVESDSWLADFDALQSAYSRHFGAERLRICDYDEAVAKTGDVLPAILSAMDLPDLIWPQPGEIRLNATSPAGRVREFFRKLRQ